MKKEQLLNEIQDMLQRDEALELDMQLSDIDEWDSLAIISMISLYDELFGVIVKTNELKNCQSVNDLINLVADKIED
ncbi:MAG: acyl carrier protein [Arcobacteraceae bacterium]|jgi:acyl carrier protein|nr:acyl carrier protein [Arcobacteraceae bacterium]MDY0327521.1 acyl carrier protein [Arcobacteraceae bacterium]